MSLSTLGAGSSTAWLLFNSFIRDVAVTEQPKLAGLLGSLSPPTPLPRDLQTTAQSLLDIARAFRNSPYRQQVTEQAVQFCGDPSQENIQQMLSQIMTSAINTPDVFADVLVTAFYFLFDVLCQVTIWTMAILMEVFRWCYESIQSVIDTAVMAAGGWNKVLKVVPIAVGTGFLVAAVGTIGTILGVGFMIGKALF